MDSCKNHQDFFIFLRTNISKIINITSYKFRRLRDLRYLYFVVTAVGIILIICLHTFLITRQTKNADVLISLLSRHVSDIDRSCVNRISRDSGTLKRIHQRIQELPLYHENKIENILQDELKECVKFKPSIGDPCKIPRSLLKKNHKVDFEIPPPSLWDIAMRYKGILEEGYYAGPPGCSRPRHSTLIILPYRDRESHLRYWLHYTIPILIQQKLRFQILLVEQEEGSVFNKGQLMNSGFEWAMSNTEYRWGCVVFHDVDMILEIFGTLYKCKGKNSVIHFARYIDKFNYSISGKIGVTVGGAVGFTEHQYQLVNGYSNVYWGWGGEDDDMYSRIRKMSLKLVRYKSPYGRYKMIPHRRDQGNPKNAIRYKLLKEAQSRMYEDGLSNLATKIITVERHRAYIKLVVKVNLNNVVIVPVSQNVTTKP